CTCRSSVASLGGDGLEDRGDAEAAGRAHRDERAGGRAVLALVLGELLGGLGDDPAAGRGERVTRGERGAVDVDPVRVDRAERAVEAELGAAVLVVGPGG